MNKISTLKIALSFVVLCAVVYFGYQFVASKIIDSKHFDQLEPGNVTLLGVDTKNSHYKIIVSNQIAQLVQVANSKFEAGDMGGDDTSDSSDKKRIPLKEMVQSLQGNEKALSEMVTKMNDDLRHDQTEIPPNPVIWKVADVEQALNGDPALKKKLVHDVNTNLDGTPADFINMNAVLCGIVLDVPVPVRVSVRGVPTTLVAHVQIPYRAPFTRKVETDLASKGLNPSVDAIKGYYLQEAKKVVDAKQQEPLARALRSLYAPDQVTSFSQEPETILADTRVVLNENYIEDADKQQEVSESGKPLYDLNLELTDEGRDRLWQYSRGRVGNQLLLIVNGVAIAAPTVRHELAQKSITITQMVDPDLVDDAINTIKGKGRLVSASKK